MQDYETNYEVDVDTINLQADQINDQNNIPESQDKTQVQNNITQSQDNILESQDNITQTASSSASDSASDSTPDSASEHSEQPEPKHTPNRLFYIHKFSSQLLHKMNYEFSLDFKTCFNSGLIVSVGDSQMLDTIRDLTNHQVDRELLEKFYAERDRLKQSKHITPDKKRKIEALQNQIYKMMSIDEYITVTMESVKEYTKLYKKGFTFNGKHYKRASCSASQARVSTVVFVAEDILPEFKKRLNNGRNVNKPIAASKYNAYFGLYSSASKQVTKPRFCIIKDYCDYQDVDVSWSIENPDWTYDDFIEERTINNEFNRFDGCGLISPSMADQWGIDLSEDYTPSQFCIRTSFTKGLVNVFDFVEWCKCELEGIKSEDEKYLITDIYGKIRDLREIDVVLTEGMAKLWDSWDTQEDYERCCEENGIKWRVTKYSPKEDKEASMLNYQYLQTLKIDVPDFHEKVECDVETDKVEIGGVENNRDSNSLTSGSLLVDEDGVIIEDEEIAEELNSIESSVEDQSDGSLAELNVSTTSSSDQSINLVPTNILGFDNIPPSSSASYSAYKLDSLSGSIPSSSMNSASDLSSNNSSDFSSDSSSDSSSNFSSDISSNPSSSATSKSLKSTALGSRPGYKYFNSQNSVIPMPLSKSQRENYVAPDIIERICKVTKDYILGVTGDNIYYTLLFCMGQGLDEEGVRRLLASSDNYWLKTLLLEHNLLYDKYTRSKIFELISTKLDQACLGRLIVRGNYQAIVADPYALMQWATGQKVVGLLKPDEFFSQFWYSRGVYTIACERSPLTYRSEHVIKHIPHEGETEPERLEKIKKYYKYANSGIITNVNSIYTLQFAGSDFDFDILFTTDCPEIINNTYVGERVTAYDVPKPTKKPDLQDEDLFNADIFSFGQQIGQITNYSTAVYSMLPLFDGDSEEYKILVNRLKQCCVNQSKQIDKTKIGKPVKPGAKIWTTRQKACRNDTEEIINRKNMENKLVIEKKPYFFRYNYTMVNKDLNKFEKKQDELAVMRFGKTVDTLLQTPVEELTAQECVFLEYYQKLYPVIDTNCIMNAVAHSMENLKAKIKVNIKSSTNFNYFSLMSKDPQINIVVLNEAAAILKAHFNYWSEEVKFRHRLKSRSAQPNTSASGLTESYRMMNLVNQYDNLDDKFNKNSAQRNALSMDKQARLQRLMDDLCNIKVRVKIANKTRNNDYFEQLRASGLAIDDQGYTFEYINIVDLTDCLVYLFYQHFTGVNKGVLWSLVGKQIFNNVLSKHTSCYIPVKDKNGELEYLYEKYAIRKIDISE